MLVADSYSEVISVAVDPIEKKPLYHFFPGETVLSIGPRGCNFSCSFCQNWQISQENGRTLHITPETLVGEALNAGCIGIAYTYTEPIVAFEFVRDTAKIARRQGLKNVLVSNGFVMPEPLAKLLEVIDAINIDLKSMDDEFYRQVCRGRLDPVLDTIRAVAKSSVHLEITNLLIPGYNDSDEQLQKIVDFVASIDERIPVHFSGYYPAYQFDAPPTPVETLARAHEIAKNKLNYIYAGNRPTSWGRDTHCPHCGNLLISRSMFASSSAGISPAGLCARCGESVDVEGPWNE